MAARLPHQEWTHEPHATCFMSRTDCFTCRPGRWRLRTTVVSSWVGQGWRPMGTRMGEVQDRWQTSVLASERIWWYDKKMWGQHNAALLWTNTFSLHKQKIFSVREDLAAHVIFVWWYMYITVYVNSIDLTCDVTLITELFQEAFPQEGLSLMEKKASRKLATIVVSTLGSMRSRHLTSTKIIKRYVLIRCVRCFNWWRSQRLGPWSCEIWSFVSTGSTQQCPPQADTADCEQGLWSKVNHELLNDGT